MPTNYPVSLDNFTNPLASNTLANPSHSTQHANANDAIEAIEYYLGTQSNPAANTITYRVDELEANQGDPTQYYTFQTTGNGATVSYPLTPPPTYIAQTMVAVSGVVQSSISDYTLNAGSIVFNVAPPNGATVFFQWSVGGIADTLTANDVSFIQLGVGAVERTSMAKMRERVSLTDYVGFTGNGSTSDAVAFQSAVDYCKTSGAELTCPAGYTITLPSSVDMRFVKFIDIKSPILMQNGTTLTIGGFGNSGNPNWKFNDVTNGTSSLTAPPPAQPVLKVTGMANGYLELGQCNYLQLYADSAVTANRLVAYNQFKLLGLVSLLEITDSGVASSYCNENYILASRILRYKIIKVGYNHNHNILQGGCFEGSNVEIVLGGTCNQIRDARFEQAISSLGVTFPSESISNRVFYSWGAISPRSNFDLPIPVNDLGSNNMVTSFSASNFIRTELVSINANSLIVANATDSICPNIWAGASGQNVVSATFNTQVILSPSLNGIQSNNANKYWFLTDLIPVNLGDTLVWECDYDGSLFRTQVFCYDANQNILLTEGAGGVYYNQSGCNINATYGYYGQGSDQPNSALTSGSVVRPEVKYIRVGMTTGAVANNFARNIGVSLYAQSLKRGKVLSMAHSKQSMRVLAGVPTKGYLPLDFMIFDSVAKLMRWVSYQWETKTTASLSAGATSVTAVAIGTVANGDICGILLTDETTHWSAVSALAGSTFTIDAIPTGKSALAGARMVFNRWTS